MKIPTGKSAGGVFWVGVFYKRSNSVAYFIKKYLKNVEDFKGIEKTIRLAANPKKLFGMA